MAILALSDAGWQTVVISVVTGAVAALSAILASWLTGRQASADLATQLAHEREQQAQRIEHERDERWRDRLTNAADEFSTASQRALLRIYEAIRAVQAAPIASDHFERAEEFVEEADRATDEATGKLSGVSLVFGPDSKTYGRAYQVGEHLASAINQLKVEPPNANQAATKANKAKTLHRSFTRAARNVIRRSPLSNDEYWEG